jgi:hypothetical protein
MSIIDSKDIDDFDKDVQKRLSYFNLSGMQMSLKGSSSYKYLKYKSDYDVLVAVRKETAPTKVFNDLKSVLEKIEKDNDTYFIELKLQTKKGEKTRFYHGDVFSYSDFEKVYTDMAFFKVDMVMCIKNKFYEASCIYKLDNNEILTREEIMKNIKEDIEEYKAKGYYYKVLKRWFSIYAMYNNIGPVEFLVQVFNSELGKIYEKVCNLSAIELLYQYYKDDRTMEKIEHNLKLLNEDLNIKKINRKMHDYLKLINKEARTIYSRMKEEVNYP